MSVRVLGVNNLEGGGEGSGDRTQRVTYKSYASAPPNTLGPDIVTAAAINFSGLDIGSPWTNDLTSLCRSIRSRCLRRVDSVPPKWEWETTFEFSSQDSGKDTQQGPTKEKDPVLRPPHISCRVETYDVAATKDRGGYPVTNSAKDPIVRTKKMSRVIFKYSRYMRHWEWDHNLYAESPMSITWGDGTPTSPVTSWSNTIGFNHSRNYQAWVPTGPYRELMGRFACGVGEAKIESLASEVVFEFGGCVKVDCEVRIDPRFHFDVFLDQGFFFLATPGTYSNPYVPGFVDSAGNVHLADGYQAPAQTPLPTVAGSTAPLLSRRQFTDRHGFPASQPQLLDGAGNPLGDGMAPQERSYQYYQFRDWDVAPLGGPGGLFS